MTPNATNPDTVGKLRASAATCEKLGTFVRMKPKHALALATLIETQAREVERLREALITLNTKAYARRIASDDSNLQSLRCWEVEQIADTALSPEVKQ